MAERQAERGDQRQPGTMPGQPGAAGALAAALPGPDAMLGVWTSWMEAMTGAAGKGWADPGKPWWGVASDELVGGMLAAGVQGLNETLAKDPLLRSVDQMWNANPLREVVPVDWAEVARALRTVWLRSLGRPGAAATAAAELNLEVWRAALEAWNEAGRRWWGGGAGADGDGAAGAKPAAGAGAVADKRFAAPEWQSNPAYRTLKEAYLLASDWLLRQGRDVAEGLDERERHRLEFHLRQFVDAMSPTLLLVSNPAALKRAMETGGASLADGARNLMDDLKAGRLSMVDATAFAPGKNMALSPGKVVLRNRLIELIQYAPSTEQVHATPLLILPPWINKFYILDLQPKNSMVRHLVSQGFTVFMVSWKNPDASMEEIGFEDYMELGPLAASDAVREITGAKSINVMGYCIGGTLLAATLAWLEAKGDRRFNAATFMVSLQDFSRVGDTAVFLDEPGLALIEQQMMERGYLEGREMANMFNLLRSNDLIWSNVVNNYLMGQKPAAFDLLYWNSDATRMCRAAHAWYLRNTYVENNLVKPGKVVLKGEPIDLGRVALDAYAVGAEKDHIVPWDAAWKVTRLLGGKVRYVLASSGHIAGIINPPGGKGIYWTNDADPPPANAEEWRRGATRHEGSWWTDWAEWLAARSGRKVRPPAMGGPSHPQLADAPGTYVMEK
jgi:polyhydroxyalkanoate synthase subunit PhaC